VELGLCELQERINQRRNVHRNLPPARLIEIALAKGEGILTNNGALRVTTGKYTGRSPNDRFIVDEEQVSPDIWWGSVNRPFSPDAFDRLCQRVLEYLGDKTLYVFDGYLGADPAYRLSVRIINEKASQNLFANQLFLHPTTDELLQHEPEFTVIAAPGFQAVPERDGTRSEAFVLISLARRLVLIGGTHYCGEIKKSMFSIMNYLLPARGVLPMHCSANEGPDGDVALFFGLSGTGKTTLSASPQRRLIGDDEHGWSQDGVFNFEGGCYAKCINLSAEYETQIWAAIRFGALVENVVTDDGRMIRFEDGSLTENTRASYPLSFIPGAVPSGCGEHPRTIIFLTADAFGVLPPIAKLTREQAMYHFLSGYTSKLAGTERGVRQPEATFSPCFGAPFLPRHPLVYAELLGKRIQEHNTAVYLVNTGRSGGPYGVGSRINLHYTRSMVNAVLRNELEFGHEIDPVFKLALPKASPGVPMDILNPRKTWADPAAYDEQARKLAHLFRENFNKFSEAPRALAAAPPL